MKRPPCVVDEQRALAARAPRRAGSRRRRARSDGTGRTRGRRAPRRRGRPARGPRRARRAGSSSAPRAPRSRRSRAASRARPDRAAVGDDAGAAAVARPRARATRSPSAIVIRGCSRTRAASAAAIALPVSAPPRVHDAADASDRPRGRGRRRTRRPSSTRSAIRAGASSVSTVHRALAAEAAPGAERVLGVQLGSSSSPSAAATPPCACQLFEAATGPFDEHEHVGLGRRAERRVEPGDTAADDDQIDRRRSRHAAHSRFSPQSR